MTPIPVSEFPDQPTTNADEVYVVKNIGLREGTHKFHRFPGKFIPHIPRWAIKKYANMSRPSKIIDPFCGSGTTLVEAALMGHQPYGFDVDPIACLISRVKTTPIAEENLVRVVEDINERLKTARSGAFRPSIPTLHHWFSESAVEELSALRGIIEVYRHDTTIFDFLAVVFLSVIRRVSNADNQTQKTYVSHTHLKTPERAIPLFTSNLFEYSARILEFSKKVKMLHGTLVISSDARTVSQSWDKLKTPKADLVITSPPYVKSVDYVYNQMAEYFWIGDLFEMETQSKQNTYKARYIGTEKVPSSEFSSVTTTGMQNVDEIVSQIRTTSPKNAYITWRYFVDLRAHFMSISDILAPGAHYISVVGDSTINGIPILTHELLRETAEPAGFEFKEMFPYEIRNRYMRFPRMDRGGIVKYDWVIDFQQKR